MISSELETEWHPTLNLPLVFNQSLPTSKKYWWLGKCGHEWDAFMHGRIKGNGCPICSNLRVLKGFNDLATTHPKIVPEWHPTKNGILMPDQVTAGSSLKVWWQCLKLHDWEAPLARRTQRNSGCPFCSGRVVQAGYNDLASQNPSLASEWHPTKNGELQTTQITACSNKKVWWLGKCNHEWKALINNRAKGIGCPVCSGKTVLSGFNDLVTIHPHLASEWHPTKNGHLTPSQVSAGSRIKIWWKCDKNHEWEAAAYSRRNGKSGCPVCSGHLVLAGVTDLSALNPELAAEWHPTKNGGLTPDHITFKSSKRIWWFGKCGHEWSAILGNRAKGTGCPICANLMILIGSNDLASQNPSIASKWHPTKNGHLEPTQVTSGSNRRVWWQCELGHEWQITIHKFVKNDVCPICSKRKLLVGFNDLATMNPEVAAEWHPIRNGELKPTQVTSNSSKKFWWQCKLNHEWSAGVSARTVYYSGCPNCAKHVSKAEDQIKEFLEELGLIVEGSNRTILGGKKEIDLWIPSHNVGIEFNGLYWHKEKYRGKTLHHDKWQAAQKAGIQLIQIWEDDWNKKPELVKQLLKQQLGVVSDKQVGSPKTNVITITESQAKKFLNENHLQGFVPGCHYLGLAVLGDIDTLQAVMVLEEKLEAKDKTLNIIRFASLASVLNDFRALLAHATKTYMPDSLTVIADHCTSDHKLYESAGFITEEVLAPDYMYVVKNERKSRLEYPLERFRDDPKLLWEEELTERELADLNGLDRIWDAGKTRYCLSL